MPHEHPNIVFILSDDHGYGDSSCYDGPNVRTPQIDRIAADGIRFTQFYANSPVCSPSRAALMTGRHPDMVGVPGVIRTRAANSWGHLDPDCITLPELLGPAGYHCTLVGKWHLGLDEENHPGRRGFHQFRGFLGDMMEDYYTHLRDGNNYMRHNDHVIEPKGHATDLFTQWAIETIESRADGGEPFFLYLAYNAPHTPIQPPDEWLARVKKREPGIDEKRARYVALVEHMDAGIGKVLDCIATSTPRNTLVIYASDNGGQLDAGACNAPWRGAKQEMYEGGIRVPCCASWPGKIASGRVASDLAMLMDWFPTICEAAGIGIDHEIEALSILDLLEGRPCDLDDRLCYWVRREGGSWGDREYHGQAYQAVRKGEMKLLQNHAAAPLELYDMIDDDGERHDLSMSHRDQVKELAGLMQEQVRRAGAIPWRKKDE